MARASPAIRLGVSERGLSCKAESKPSARSALQERPRRYSPHLNKAETYWRKAKYQWLKPADYGSFTKLVQKIYHIFNQIGLEYKMAFKELHALT